MDGLLPPGLELLGLLDEGLAAAPVMVALHVLEVPEPQVIAIVAGIAAQNS